MSQAANGSAQGGQRSWKRQLVAGIAIVFGVLFIAYIATSLFGDVGGEEFSPETFERRSFTYREIPLIGVQVSPINRNDETNSLESYLRTQSVIPKKKSTEPRWDLVYAQRSGVEVFRGDAAILCAYLDAEDREENLYWETWSEQNPKLAKILWPAIARVANQQLYIFAPDILELAEAAVDPDSFSQELNRTLAQKYLQLGAAQQDMGLHETAVELFTEALVYVPSDKNLIEHLAKSQRMLDQDDETEVDVAKPED